MADITGTINGTTSNSKIKSRILWEETTDPATNTGSVTATLQLRTLTGYQTYSGDSDFYLKINGVTYSTISIYKSVGPGDAWVTCYTKTVTGIAHNTDGTKSIAISGWGNMYGTSVSTITVGGTVALYAIPRASTFSTTSSVEVNGTNAVSVTITRMVSTYTHTVDIYAGENYATSTYKQRYTGVATSQSFAIPVAWRLAMPTATSMTARVTVTTYSGATQIGDALTHTFTLRVPATVKPVLYVNGIDGGNIQTSPLQPTAILEFEHYVQGYSGIKARFRNLASAFESEVAISEYFVTYAGVKSSIEPDAEEYDTVYAKAVGDVAVVLQLAGVYTFTVGVTDARGMTTTANVSITCFDYDDPSLTNIDVFRCNSAGVKSDTGTYISVSAKALITTLGGENAVTYLRAQYKVTSASTYGAWSNLTSETALVIGGGAILTTQSYDVRFQIQDTVGNSSYPHAIVPTSDVAFNLKAGGRGGAFGKHAETDECMEFAWKIRGYSGATFDAAIEVASDAVGRQSILNLGGMPLRLLASGTDFDTVTETGIYGVRYSSTSYNGPTDYWGVLISVYTDFTGTAFQIYQPDSFAVTYFRKYSGAWSSWSKMGVDDVYPVGSIYMSVNSTNPSALFGGTWEQITDTFLLAAGSTYAAGATGGEASHTLSVAEMPAHMHRMRKTGVGGTGTTQYVPDEAGNFSNLFGETVGGDGAHNNMPPYLAVYVWKRTA